MTTEITTDLFEDESDYVNFPVTAENSVKNSLLVQDVSVNFPQVQEVDNDDNKERVEETTESNIQYYNQTEDNNAEVIVEVRLINPILNSGTVSAFTV